MTHDWFIKLINFFMQLRIYIYLGMLNLTKINIAFKIDRFNL